MDKPQKQVVRFEVGENLGMVLFALVIMGGMVLMAIFSK